MTSRAPGTPCLFVTGGAGFLGRHLVDAAVADGWHVVAPGSAELDVRDAEAVRRAVEDAGATAVAHLAYRRDERDTIVDGSRNVAHAAVAAGARLVHLSTDVVFGGRPEAYTEDDAPDPVIDYGRHKRDAELAVAEVCPTAVLVRTSLLYGTPPALSPAQTAVAEAIAGTSPMTFFTDEVRCVAHAADLAAAVLELARLAHVRGPLHVAGPRPVSRAAFAARTARELGLDPARLSTATIAERGLERPANVVLDSSRAAALGIVVRDPLDDAAAGVESP